MLFPEIDFTSPNTVIASFDRIADSIANELIFKINSVYYRIVDFEFYTKKDEIMPDSHTYNHDLQRQSGKIYVHASGMDITCGKKEYPCGILIRSVLKLNNDSDDEAGFIEKQISGPQSVATEIFSNLYPLNSNLKNEISLIDIEKSKPYYKSTYILKGKRVGLTLKPDDKENIFIEIPLRYVVIIPKYPKPYFQQQKKGFEQLLRDNIKLGKITETDAEAILGSQLPKK